LPNTANEFIPTETSKAETSLFSKDFLKIEHGPPEAPQTAQGLQQQQFTLQNQTNMLQ